MDAMDSKKFKPRIYIDKEGNWYQDGYPIIHRRTYLYNNKLLKRDNEGRYFIDEGRGKVYVQIEDTPFVIKDIYLTDNGTLNVTLNDQTVEPLDIHSLKIKNNIPYAKVKNGEFTARFNRPAYYRFTELIKKDGDKYYIEINNDKYYINFEY